MSGILGARETGKSQRVGGCCQECGCQHWPVSTRWPARLPVTALPTSESAVEADGGRLPASARDRRRLERRLAAPAAVLGLKAERKGETKRRRGRVPVRSERERGWGTVRVWARAARARGEWRREV